MNDVASLQSGHWQWSGWLTPKGRVIALFALLKIDDEKVWLLLQDADADEFTARLQRFVFRSKLKIVVRGDLRAGGSFDSHPQASGAHLSDSGGGIALDLSGAGGARTLRIDAGTGFGVDPVALARWTGFDLAHGLPRLSASQHEQWTPQQLSLDRLRAYSVRKGCYPGQEIVARTHFLGQAKRGLVLFESDAPLAAGAQLTDGERALGSVVSAVSSGQRHLALAVLPMDSLGSAPRSEGIALLPLALLDGLAR